MFSISILSLYVGILRIRQRTKINYFVHKEITPFLDNNQLKGLDNASQNQLIKILQNYPKIDFMFINFELQINSQSTNAPLLLSALYVLFCLPCLYPCQRVGWYCWVKGFMLTRFNVFITRLLHKNESCIFKNIFY